MSFIWSFCGAKQPGKRIKVIIARIAPIYLRDKNYILGTFVGKYKSEIDKFLMWQICPPKNWQGMWPPFKRMNRLTAFRMGDKLRVSFCFFWNHIHFCMIKLRWILSWEYEASFGFEKAELCQQTKYVWSIFNHLTILTYKQKSEHGK